jgi:hypothetical protein
MSVSGEGTEASGETVRDDLDAIESAFDQVVDRLFEAASDPGARAREYADQQVRAVGEAAEDLQAKATQFAENAERDFRADPTSFVTGAKVEYDLDPDDGNMSLRYTSALVDVDADWQQDRGTTYDGRVGGDVGPLPESVRVHYAEDTEGNVSFTEDTGITLPFESPITLESHGSYAGNDEGYDIQGRNTIGTEVEGEDLTGGVQGGFTDRGDDGMAVRAGPVVGISKGGVELGDDAGDLVQGQAESTVDASFSTLGGETRGGVRITSTGEVDVAGEQLASLNETSGVDVTSGPDGTSVGMDHGGGFTVGTDDTGTITGSSTTRREIGVDADGNRTDTTTTTTDGRVVTTDGDTVDLGDTTTEDGGFWATVDDASSLLDDVDAMLDDAFDDTDSPLDDGGSFVEDAGSYVGGVVDDAGSFVEDAGSYVGAVVVDDAGSFLGELTDDVAEVDSSAYAMDAGAATDAFESDVFDGDVDETVDTYVSSIGAELSLDDAADDAVFDDGEI